MTLLGEKRLLSAAARPFFFRPMRLPPPLCFFGSANRLSGCQPICPPPPTAHQHFNLTCAAVIFLAMDDTDSAAQLLLPCRPNHAEQGPGDARTSRSLRIPTQTTSWQQKQTTDTQVIRDIRCRCRFCLDLPLRFCQSWPVFICFGKLCCPCQTAQNAATPSGSPSSPFDIR